MSNGDPDKLDKQIQSKSRNDIANVSNVLQSVRIRRDIRVGYAHYRKLLSDRYYILFHFNILFWIIFINIQKTIK